MTIFVVPRVVNIFTTAVSPKSTDTVITIIHKCDFKIVHKKIKLDSTNYRFNEIIIGLQVILLSCTIIQFNNITEYYKIL